MNEVTYNVEIADLNAFQRHYRRVLPVMFFEITFPIGT